MSVRTDHKHLVCHCTKTASKELIVTTRDVIANSPRYRPLAAKVSLTSYR
jgi:hypothetical protein